MNIKVVILNFSSRKNGNCAEITDYIEHYYNRTNVCSFVIDKNSMPACGECDYECLKPDMDCRVLNQQEKAVFDAVCESDLVYLVIPNYCGYPCANYFAFNERSVGYFNMDESLMEKYMSVPKRFIIVSNSEGDNFKEAMRQQTSGTPDILYLKSRKYHKSSIAGDLLTSNAAKADLQAFLAHAHT